MIRRQLAGLAAPSATSGHPAYGRKRLFRTSARYGLASLKKSPSLRRTQGAGPNNPPPAIPSFTLAIGSVKDEENSKGFLAGCMALRPHLKINQVVKLSKQYDITPQEITTLSKAAGRFIPDSQNTLVIPLLLAASTLSDPKATITLVSRALQAPQNQQADILMRPGMELTLRHLSALSSAGDPAAMVLLGRILEKEGKGAQALKLFQKATEAEWDEAHGFESGVASAWLSLGRLKLKSNDRAGGEAALKKGADLNDAHAAFHYALTHTPGQRDYHTYIMKAAVSGIVEAQHNLGMFYLQQASARDKTLFWRMAKEWFILAATEKFAPSQLNLALMLKDEGKGSEGLEWVDKAQRNPAFTAEAEKVKARWKNGGVYIGDSGKISIT